MLLPPNKKVAEGLAKNTFNSLRGIKDWRTDDVNGDRNDLPALSKGKLQDFFYIRNLYGNIEDVFNRPVYSSPEDWIDVAIREPTSDRGYFSKLVTTRQSRRCLNLGSYNYLGFGGLNTHCTPLVRKAVMDHPITNSSPSAELGYSFHVREVEETTSKFVGKEAAVVVGMGFATNSTVIPALCGKGDLIISDALNHNSIVEGVRLSGAKVKPFKHNCPGDLELILQDAVAGKGPRYNKILVIVEGIYSMEGELCCLPDIVRVCKMYGAYIWLDEAHSIGAVGATGRGVCEELGVDPADVDIMMWTFTKSFGAAGGYIASDHETIARVRQYAAGCTDAVSMPPAVCAQILASLRVIAGDDGTDIGARKLRALRENAKFFRDGLEELGLEVLGEHPSPVMPVMLYQPYKIGDFSRLAFNRRLATVVVGAPATPVKYPRVRFCVSAAHSREDLADALAAISDISDELSIKFKLTPPNKWFPGSLEVIERKEHGGRVRRAAAAAAARPAALAAARSLATGRNTARFAPLHSRGTPLSDDYGDGGPPTSSGPIDTYSITGITTQPKEYNVMLSSQDILALTTDPIMKEACAATIETLGLGSCSPRGFYGTFPPHMDVEQTIADFLGCQEAVLYSFGACTVSSVIPSLGHRSDVAVVDRGVGHGILGGLRLAKMDVRWYNHCDADDCARVFANLEAEDGVTSARLARPGRRRWLITEACFQGTGRVAPLPELVALKETHHARLILDESCSFGAMGATGRGLSEHFGVDAGKVDVITASLEGAGASVGGFCAGDTGVVAYQRLMGSGYVFSASLPPYLATAAAHAIRRVSAEPRLVAQAQASASALLEAALSGRIPGFTTDADAGSPVVPLRLAAGSSAGNEINLLAQIASRARSRGIGVCVARVNPLVPAQHAPPVSLRVYASAAHTKTSLSKAFVVLAEEAAQVLPTHALSIGVEAARLDARLSMTAYVEAPSSIRSARNSIDPGSTVLAPALEPAKSVNAASPPRSRAKCPGATLQMDGIIRLVVLDDQKVKLVVAHSTPLADDQDSLSESLLSPRIPTKKLNNRSASWSGLPAESSLQYWNVPADESDHDILEPFRTHVASAAVSSQSGIVLKRTTSGTPLARFDPSDQDSPRSLSVPALVVLLHWHKIFRRYILNQIDITAAMVPTMLRKVGLNPDDSGWVRYFYFVAGYLGSRGFHANLLPLLVWTCDCAFTRLVMVFYCLCVGIGCLMKGALATSMSSIRPANPSTGSLMRHRVHSWPSVAGIQASALPFLILRWRYGFEWVWNMKTPWWAVTDYSLAFAYMTVISLARMANGDSPANVQGGIVVGAILLRCLLPHVEWATNGLEASTVMSSQGYVLVGIVLACVCLYPMPLNAHGEVLYAASTCYRRMWRTFSYMLFFAAGSVWRPQSTSLPITRDGANAFLMPSALSWLSHLSLVLKIDFRVGARVVNRSAAVVNRASYFEVIKIITVKYIIGHAASQFSVWAISYVAQAFVECCLRGYVSHYKKAGGTRVGKGVFGGGRGGDVKAESEAQADVAQGTVHMRLAAITVVELAQDVTGALVCAHGVPRLFDAIGI